MIIIKININYIIDIIHSKIMVLIQEGSTGYFITLRKGIAEAKRWIPGDELAFEVVGGEIQPQAGDVLIRKVRSAKRK
ncbi:MAG: hypothetical protein KGI33_12285 [Thaumarchaeota archaeon]|nr:hypothetical protein [Nitrososphaerota archaeon]